MLKVVIVTALVLFSCSVMFLFHSTLDVGAVFTHFFYVPIVLAALWWRKKGIAVAVLLAAMLVLSHFFIRSAEATANDLFRSVFFIFVSVFVAFLSERVCMGQKSLGGCEEKFGNMFETVQHGLYFSDLEGRFLDVNDALVDMLGYDSKEELLQISIPTDLYLDPSYRQAFQKVVERGGYVKDYDVQFKKKYGEVISVLMTAQVTRDDDGKIVGYQGLIIDITERLKLEQQLFRSAKMASIGKLAAGVAHEINNPLGGVVAFSHLLQEKIPEEDPRRSHVDKIVHAALRCKEIVQGLLKFSRQTAPNFLPSNVNAVLGNVLSLFKEQALFHNIEIVQEFDNALPKVIADSSQLEQVFTNIILNAAEAMNGDGKIIVKTSGTVGDGHVEVAISDTGPGIPEKDISKIFEPFFSTKDPSLKGSGTGLGLAVSYGIIERHKGNISVSSEAGQGTTFIIRLPIEEEEK